MRQQIRPRALRALITAALLGAFATPASAAPFIYVANSLSDDVSVFDAATRLLVATVPVGDRPFPIAITPDGSRALVGNSGSGTVSVIETAGNSVIATIPVGQNPYGISIHPGGTRAYVANADSGDVSVISLVSNTVTRTIATTHASGVAFNPAGTRVYVTQGASNSVTVIDPATDTISNTIATVGVSPWSVIFSPDGTRAYVTNYSGANVTVINASTDAVITRWAVGNQPVGIALNGDGSRLYTANSGSDTVSIVDTTAGFLLNNLPVGHRPFGVSTDPDGRLLYAANAGDFGNPGSVSVFDGAANVVLATLPTAVYSAGVGNFVTPYTPPGVPTSVAAAPGNQRATVSFNPPFSDGGRPISEYTATCGAQTRSASSSPIVVDQLANGVSVGCQVFATNDRGDGAASAAVMVTPASPPGAPAITEVTSGNASVTVAFTPPASDGGQSISSYTASCGSASTTGAASPLVVAGLVNGQFVTCTVYASNGIGDGPPSAPSSAVTPMTVPGAPAITSAVRGDGTVSLHFTTPDDGGGDISGYFAMCQPDNLMLVGIASPLVVEGLDEVSSYTCRVSAYNQVGSGAESTAVVIPPRIATDLAVSVSNNADFISGGGSTVYAMTVINAGANGVTGAHIVNTLTADTGVTAWTCAGKDGAQCPASGSGNVDFLADLPAGGSLHITLSVAVPKLPESPLTSTASVSVPAGWRDTNSSNDSASDGPDVRGIFRAGFE